LIEGRFGLSGKETMRKRFIQLTSGWIPVSVLLLFATALVLGQDRSGMQEEGVPFAEPEASVVTHGFLDSNDRTRLESIRRFVDTVLPMPESIEISIGTNTDAGTGVARPEAGPVE
jgi:hypothetical protein